MTTAPSNLTALSSIYRHREDAPTTTDVSYLVYATLLVLLMVGVPVTRTLVILLSSPEILAFFQSPTAEHVVGIVGGVILILLAAFGSVRGPVLLSPFFVTLLADTATPRSRTLSRSFASASFFVLAGFLFLGIVVSAIRVFSGGLPFLLGLEFAIACLLFAVVASMVWLWGQSLGYRAWILVVGLAGDRVGWRPDEIWLCACGTHRARHWLPAPASLRTQCAQSGWVASPSAAVAGGGNCRRHGRPGYSA